MTASNNVNIFPFLYPVNYTVDKVKTNEQVRTLPQQPDSTADTPRQPLN